MAIDVANSKFSDKALDFLDNSTAGLCILHGSVRSGKTVNCTTRWLTYLAAGPQGDLVMMGKDRGALSRNVLNDLFDLVGKSNYKWIDRQRGELQLFNRRVWTLGASTVRAEERLRGATLAGAYCDEASTYPEVVWHQLTARLSVKGAQRFANTNPDSPEHWFYKQVIQNPEIENRQIWHFTMDDNPNLDEGYKQDLIQQYSASPIFYKRLVLGEWVVAEGAIYQYFADNEAQFEIAPYNRGRGTFTIDGKEYRLEMVNVGIDWGGNKSAHAFVATGITEDFQHLIVLKSHRMPAKGTTPDMVIDEILRFLSRVMDVYGRVDAIFADSAEQLMINLLAERTDIGVWNSIKREIVDRIRFILILMATKRLYLTKESRTVAQFFRTALYYSKVKTKDKRLDDGSYDQDSGDALEYSVERYMEHMVAELK